MDDNKDNLEREVFAALEAIHEQYLKIDQLVNVMLEKQSLSQPITEEIRLLETAKNEIAAIELATSEVKTSYRQINVHGSPAVKTLSAESTQLLRGTIKKIEALENATKDSQQKLLPQIGKNVRASQMQKAYGTA